MMKIELLSELERETENTRRIILRLNDENLAWKPHEKSMSAGELAAHIVELHNWVNLALRIDNFDFKKHYSPFKPVSVAELLDVLNLGYDKNVELIKDMTTDDWGSIWILSSGEHIIAQMPKSAAMRFVIQNHLIHHRGQLSLYLRLMGIPVPGIYGPSADEMNKV